MFINPIKRNPGIYIEELGPLATSTVTWKIIQQINLDPFFNRGAQLKTAWSVLQRGCTPRNSECSHAQLLKQLYRQIEDISRDADRVVEMLQGHELRKPDRVRRAWFSAVGKVSRFLFGTLDEAAETELKTLIEKSENKTRNLAKLLANQTELIYTEFGRMHDKATELENIVMKLEKVQQHERDQIAFVTVMQLFEENVLQYEIDTQMLTDAVLFATQGAVHPRFINPEQIEKTAAQVTESVPGALFPTAGKPESVIEVIKISEITILLSNSQLVYHLAVPLLDYNQYKLVKASPLQ